MTSVRPRRRGALVVAALVATALPAGPARADAGRAQADLERGERAYASLDFDEALAAGTRVARERGLTHEQLVRATRLVALAHAVLGNETAARDAAILLLTYAPGFQLEADASPKVRAPVQEARLYLRDQAVRPGLEAVAILPPGEVGAVRVTLRDPSHLARRLVVGFRWGVVGDYAIRAQAADDAVAVPVPAAPAGATRLDYYAQALDERDSVAFEAGTPATPRTQVGDARAAPPPREPKAGGGGLFASPWFWAAAGVLVVGGGTTAFLLTRTPTATAPPDRSVLAPGVACGGAPCN